MEDISPTDENMSFEMYPNLHLPIMRRRRNAPIGSRLFFRAHQQLISDERYVYGVWCEMEE